MTESHCSQLLDLVFVLDCTSSMGSYIAIVQKQIEEITRQIFESSSLQKKGDLRIGIIAYRDHPPQDNTFVYKVFDFTSDVNQVYTTLRSLQASGGGDLPEAVTAALHAASKMAWRDCTRMVVLVADAPPHAIGERSDYKEFKNGTPDGYDPLVVARDMAANSIILFVVACEPSMSEFDYATDFYTALINITSGAIIPLTNAALLKRVIVGYALESLDLNHVIDQLDEEQIKLVANAEPEENVLELLMGVIEEQPVAEAIENDVKHDLSDEALHNVEVYMNSPNLAAARPRLKRVTKPRLSAGSKQEIILSKGPISEEQAKRLARLAANRMNDS